MRLNNDKQHAAYLMLTTSGALCKPILCLTTSGTVGEPLLCSNSQGEGVDEESFDINL